jgi:hypothetical protein
MFRRAAEILGHLTYLGRPAKLLREFLGGVAHGERPLLEMAWNVDRPALVAKVALQLAEDRRRGVARELRPAAGLETVALWVATVISAKSPDGTRSGRSRPDERSHAAKAPAAPANAPISKA